MQSAEAARTVLITGAGGSLGSALSVEFAQAGWQTVLIDKTQRVLDPVRERIVSATGVEPIIQPFDLLTLTPSMCEELVAALEAGPGRLDALVHCAASFEGLRPLDQVDPQSWLRDFQVNVHVPWLLSVHCLGLLRQAPVAHMVFLIDDLKRLSGAYWGAYGAGKHALNAMSTQFASELSNTAVRVLSVDPGPMQSPLRARAYHSEDPSLTRPPQMPAREIYELIAGGTVAV